MRITVLPSDKGDCLFLEAGDGTAILADGGMRDSYARHVRPFLGGWARRHPGRPLDLVYVSHIDQDHIAGVLQLMDDTADWRVYRHKLAKGEAWNKPPVEEPPGVGRIWHNAFHDMVGENAGEIGSMLAARAARLSNSADARSRALAGHYGGIASSIPEAIKLSRRVSAGQLRIPLNAEFGGRLAMVRDPPDEIRLRDGGGLAVRVVGPFGEDLEKLREDWDTWLRSGKGRSGLERLRRWGDEEDGRFDSASAGGAAFEADDGLGQRDKVTAPNLASLMLLLEEDGRRVLLTGDGHHKDICAGLEHNGVLRPGNGLHLDALKVQHHGSEHNLDRGFARRVTADHYIFCGNGLHENPDLRVVRAILDSRLGGQDIKSANPEADRAFHLWFSCSAAFLKTEIARRRDERLPAGGYPDAAKHFAKVERLVRDQAEGAPGRFQAHFLADGRLELDI